MKNLLTLALVLVAEVASAGSLKWARQQMKADIQQGRVDAVQYSACMHNYCKGNHSSCMAYCARFAANPQAPSQIQGDVVGGMIANNPYAGTTAQGQQPCDGQQGSSYTYYGNGSYGSANTNGIYGSDSAQSMVYPYYGNIPSATNGSGTWSNDTVNAAGTANGGWTNEVSTTGTTATSGDVSGTNPYSFETGLSSGTGTASLTNSF